MKRSRGRPRKSAAGNSTLENHTKAAPTRQSRRISSISNTTKSKSTPSKSEYFEHDSNNEKSASEEEIESDFEDKDASITSTSDRSSDLDDGDETDETSTKKRRKVSKSPNTAKGAFQVSSAKGKELWRTGVKPNLEPGQEVFIELPKARQAGTTPYKEDLVAPTLYQTLCDREWLKIHDADFRQSQRDFSSFIERLTEKLADKDDTLPELPPKDIIFRIYRDIRFSKDPTPYKTHFSAAWSRTGRKGPYAAYYLQIAPGSNFLGGGLWCPEAASLHLLRRNIDRRPERIRRVLLKDGIRRTFLNVISKDEDKAIKGFISQNSSNALKRKPKGYGDDNPNISLLRLKNFTIGRKLSDAEILAPDSLDRVADMFGTLEPFITYLNSVVMPDDTEDTSDDSDEGVDSTDN